MTKLILRRKMGEDAPPVPALTYADLPVHAYFRIVSPLNIPTVYKKFKGDWSQDASGFWVKQSARRLVAQVEKPPEWGDENADGTVTRTPRR